MSRIDFFIIRFGSYFFFVDITLNTKHTHTHRIYLNHRKTVDVEFDYRIFFLHSNFFRVRMMDTITITKQQQ